VQVSSRRKLDVAVLGGAAVLLAGGAAVSAAVFNMERVTRFWTSAVVADDDSAEVTEVIDYEFGFQPEPRHGIFRDLPTDIPTDSFTVESPDAPDQIAAVETSPSGLTRFRIGDPDTTVTGRHRYVIGYDLPGIVEDGRVDWETMGTEWDVGMDDVEIHLITPFELTEGVCSVGGTGASGGCSLETVEPGHVVAHVDSIGSHEGVSVEGTVGAPLAAAPAAPAPPADPPDEPGTGLLPPAGTAAAAAAIAAAPVAVLVRRAGRERVAPGGAADAAYGGDPGSPAPPPPPPVPGIAGAPVDDAERWEPAAAPVAAPVAVSEIRVDADELAAMATTEFAPPAGVTPAQGGIILTEEVRNEHKVAWLIQAAVDGAVDLDDSDPGAIVVTRTGPGAPGDGPILDVAFDGRRDVTLGSYDRQFGNAWAQLGAHLDRWRDTSGLWDQGADRRRVLIKVLGILAAAVGLLATLGGAALAGRFGAPWLALTAAGAVAFGGGLAAALRSWELRVRTPLGSGLWLRVESFRRFLAGSEAYHAEEAAKRGLLREYTAWAVAVGEIDRWSRAVAASSVIPEDAGLHYAYMAPLLIASTTSTATAPSSSGGSGGFGGGSVGGGAGGGGGGSW
jgi:hypothetical protein